MIEFNRDIILQAIEKIGKQPELRKGRESIEYDLEYNGSSYPPILVLSEASKLVGGLELKLSDFGNSTKEPFSILRGLGFAINNKKQNDSIGMNIWIEKTLVNSRPDRTSGDYALGKRLWSPIKDKRGADIYNLMRKISEDDIILHLTDNNAFTGVSKAAGKFVEGLGVPGTEWEGPAYIVELKDFVSIQPLSRTMVLNLENKTMLEKVKEKYRVFYNSELNLNQGAYITEGPKELVDLINEAYYRENREYIPYLPAPDKRISLNKTVSAEVEFKISSFLESLEAANLIINKAIVTRFICALLTKPFVILTGLSGSGKTKLAQSFAKWIINDESQICIIPVGADWTNREPLLGFPNALENGTYLLPENGALSLLIEANKSQNKHKPYFLILDEMNLSHVERYFADFLSAMESSEAIPLHTKSADWKDEVPDSIKLPPNLFIIGTVNIDETTYMFSPKVLDRASVIEFRVTKQEIETFLTESKKIDLKLLSGKGANASKSFLDLACDRELALENKKKLNGALLDFFEELKKLGAEFGYRTAFEIRRFFAICSKLEPALTEEEIIDAAVMQKLLPKIHGSRRKLEPVLKALGMLCLDGNQNIDEVFKIDNTESLFSSDIYRYPICLEKILRMQRGLVNNGFTSYAEA